jgi:hypothetical protein
VDVIQDQQTGVDLRKRDVHALTEKRKVGGSPPPLPTSSDQRFRRSRPIFVVLPGSWRVAVGGRRSPSYTAVCRTRIARRPPWRGRLTGRAAPPAERRRCHLAFHLAGNPAARLAGSSPVAARAPARSATTPGSCQVQRAGGREVQGGQQIRLEAAPRRPSSGIPSICM